MKEDENRFFFFNKLNECLKQKKKNSGETASFKK